MTIKVKSYSLVAFQLGYCGCECLDIYVWMCVMFDKVL